MNLHVKQTKPDNRSVYVMYLNINVSVILFFNLVLTTKIKRCERSFDLPPGKLASPINQSKDLDNTLGILSCSMIRLDQSMRGLEKSTT